MSTSVQAENVQTHFTPTTSASFLQQIFGILLNFSPILPVSGPISQLFLASVSYFQRPTRGTEIGTFYRFVKMKVYGLIFSSLSTVLKRFCPLQSKTTFVLVPAISFIFKNYSFFGQKFNFRQFLRSV